MRKEIFLVTNGLHTDFQPGCGVLSEGGGGGGKIARTGAMSRNRFLTSPLRALWPQLVVAYSDYQPGLSRVITPLLSRDNTRGQRKTRTRENDVILFFARNFGLKSE